MRKRPMAEPPARVALMLSYAQRAFSRPEVLHELPLCFARRWPVRRRSDVTSPSVFIERPVMPDSGGARP